MRITPSLFLGRLALVAMLAVLPATAGAQSPGTIDSTHFWSYTILDPAAGPFPVLVRDQFFPAEVSLRVERSVKLLNWVHKNQSPVRDTLNHLVWWEVFPKLPAPRLVEIENQFGRHIVGVEALDFMLVPAYKNQPSPVPPYLNHYLCYRAQGPGPNMAFVLRDEWRGDVLPVLDLQWVCNPCLKVHGGQVFPPVDPETHLAVYRVHPQSERFSPPVFDQFRSRPYLVEQLGDEWLFVPSVKREGPTASPPSTWGRLKTLYR